MKWDSPASSFFCPIKIPSIRRSCVSTNRASAVTIYLHFMHKKLFILISAAIFVCTFSFAADAQTRRRRPPVRRAVVKIPMSTQAKLSSGAVKTESGLVYLITKQGTGAQAKAGDTVSVHYTGTLTDGTKFDSSRDRGEPIEFPLGAGRVIKGWDEGIAKMKVGDQAILVIPPTIGYGARGAGNGLIPPDATLIFIVELVGIK
jgi:FKBP-type peptidyl-prolyl cis-trans isomerase